MNLTVAYQTNKEQIFIRTLSSEVEPVNEVFYINENDNEETPRRIPSSFNLLITQEDNTFFENLYTLRVNPEERHLSKEMIENINYNDAFNL